MCSTSSSPSLAITKDDLHVAGDEVVTVNAQSLEGMSHAEAITVFKKIRSGEVILEILRRKLSPRYIECLNTVILHKFAHKQHYKTFMKTKLFPTTCTSPPLCPLIFINHFSITPFH